MPCTLHSIIQFSGNSWQDSKQEVGKIFEGIQFRARNCIRDYTEPETVSGGYTEPETVSEVTLSHKLYQEVTLSQKLYQEVTLMQEMTHERGDITIKLVLKQN